MRAVFHSWLSVAAIASFLIGVGVFHAAPSGAIPLSDVAVSKSMTPTVPAGAYLTATITATETGVGSAIVTLTDTVPANTTFRYLTVPGSWSCITPAAGTAGPALITCTVSSMTNNEKDVFQVVTLVDSNTSVGTTITNSTGIQPALGDLTQGDNFFT